MKTIEIRIPQLALLLLISLLGTTSLQAQMHAEIYEGLPLVPSLVNLTFPSETTQIDADDEIELVWKINEDHELFAGRPAIRSVTVSKIRLLAQLQLGKPNTIAILNPGNNPTELSTRLRISDFEDRLSIAKVNEYGPKWKSGTKMYLHFDSMKIEFKDGTTIEEPISARQRHIGFLLK